jgi:hypothetical protein
MGRSRWIPGASSSAQRRLCLLGTALVTRGMKPDEAYKIALYYIEGPGRGLTWITALNEQNGSEKGEATSRTNAEAA